LKNILSDLDGVIFMTYVVIQEILKDEVLCKKLGINPPPIDLDKDRLENVSWHWAHELWEALVTNNIPLPYYKYAVWVLQLLDQEYNLQFYTGRDAIAIEYTRKSLQKLLGRDDFRLHYATAHGNSEVYLAKKLAIIKKVNPYIIIEDDPAMINTILREFPNIKVIRHFNYPYNLHGKPQDVQYEICNNWLEIFYKIKELTKKKRGG